MFKVSLSLFPLVGVLFGLVIIMGTLTNVFPALLGSAVYGAIFLAIFGSAVSIFIGGSMIYYSVKILSFIWKEKV